MTSDSDLKSRRDLMVKLRDDADERGMHELAIFYAGEVIRLGAERIIEARERIRDLMRKRKPEM